jgi:hypothetical protein
MFLWTPILIVEDNVQNYVLFLVCVCFVPMLLLLSLDISFNVVDIPGHFLLRQFFQQTSSSGPGTNSTLPSICKPLSFFQRILFIQTDGQMDNRFSMSGDGHRKSILLSDVW